MESREQRYYSEQYQYLERIDARNKEKIHIIWVDDDGEFLNFGKMFLERTGNITVAITTKATDIFDLLSSGLYSAIITDLEMPVFHGRDLIIQIRDTLKNIPIIVISGNEDPKEIEFLTREYKIQYYKKGGDIIDVLKNVYRFLTGDFYINNQSQEGCSGYKKPEMDPLMYSVLVHDLLNLLTIQAFSLDTMMDYYNGNDKIFSELANMHVTLKKIIYTVQEIRDLGSRENS